jgi:hypothetical protein
MIMRGTPPAGCVIEGPTLLALPEATLLVPAGWRGEADAHGSVLLRAQRGAHARATAEARA